MFCLLLPFVCWGLLYMFFKWNGCSREKQFSLIKIIKGFFVLFCFCLFSALVFQVKVFILHNTNNCNLCCRYTVQTYANHGAQHQQLMNQTDCKIRKCFHNKTNAGTWPSLDPMAACVWSASRLGKVFLM